MIILNLKIALRNILKNKVFSAINIMGLALSMACCLLIGLYVWNELQFDRFHSKYKSIARITEKQDQAGKIYNVAVTPGPLAPALRRDFAQVANTVRFGNWSGILKNGSNSFEEKNIQLTENSLFKMFDFPLVKGNAKTALLSPDEIVITEKVADKYFGKEWKNNPSILGQVFRLNNENDFRLAGIAKNVPENSSIQFDILLPINFLFNSDKWSFKWNSNNYHTYVLLKPGVDEKAFEKKIAVQLHKYNPETRDLLMLQPLGDQYLRSVFDFKTDWGKRSNIKYINIFAGVGLLLLIIACVNFVNLSTARSLKRAMEVGIRKVNGATRKQLVIQLLSESTLLAFVAGLLAIIVFNIAKPWTEVIIGANLTTSVSSIIMVPLFVVFILVIGILAGLYPAIALSGFVPVKVLKNSGGLASGKLFRQGLVVIQFTIAVSLIICTMFMYRQLRFIQQKDLGFEKDQLVSIRLGSALNTKTGPFNQDLEYLPGVIAAAPATMSLVNVENSSYVEWEGMTPDDKFLITQANVDPSFIPALHLQLLNGNNFSKQLTNDTANYILNESAVKRMGFTLSTVIGKQVSFWGAKGKVTGVVKDFHFKPLNTSIEPFIFRYQPQDRYFNLFVKLSPGNAAGTIQQIQKIYKRYEVETPFEYTFLNDSIDKLYADEKRTALVILLFSYFTIFIACLGLFGLAVFASEQRIREIGIRKVLGAGLLSITTLLSTDFLKMVVAGIVIATPVAWYVTNRWLQNYTYRVSIDGSVFLLAALLVIVLSILTVSFQALKAGAASPVKSLRSE